jgi:hypothetical protein
MKTLKSILPWLAVVIAIAALYDGWIFYSRWNEKRNTEQARANHEQVMAQKTLKLVGGSDLKITSFYASPGALHQGSTANICYGVIGANMVKLEPAVEEVWPALNRCLQVKPLKTTEYKLTAADAAGHSAAESFTLQVVR